MIDDYTIYVDMDGVVADFDQAVRDRFGKGGKEDMKPGALWGRIRNYNDNVEPWFYSLPMMPDAMELWDFLKDNFQNIEMLTASGTTPADAAGQKRKWVGEHLGWDVKVNAVMSSADKADFAHEKAILIDDRSKSIDPFIAAGGIGILHKSANNTIQVLKAMMDDFKGDS